MRSGRFDSRSVSECVDVVKVRDVIRLPEEDGWLLARTRGSHRQCGEALAIGPGKPADDLVPGTLNSVLKQAGLQ